MNKKKWYILKCRDKLNNKVIYYAVYSIENAVDLVKGLINYKCSIQSRHDDFNSLRSQLKKLI